MRDKKKGIVHFDDSTASILNATKSGKNTPKSYASSIFSAEEFIQGGDVLVLPPKLTLMQATYSLTKSAMGAGALFMPVIFYRLGWMVAIVALTGAMLATLSSLFFLHNACRRTRANDYMTMASNVGSMRLEVFTAICVTMVMMAPIIVFMRLAASYTSSVIAFMTCGTWLWSPRLLEVIMAFTVFLPISLVKDGRLLAKFSIIGMLGMLYVVFLAFCDFIIYPRGEDVSLAVINTSTSFKIIFGSLATVLFSFSSHFTVPIILQTLQDPSSHRTNLALSMSSAFTALLYLIIGLCGALQFGALTPDDFLAARPQNPAYVIGQLMIAIVNVLSFPLLIIPVRGMVSWCQDRFATPSRIKFPFQQIAPSATGEVDTPNPWEAPIIGVAVIMTALAISSQFESTGKVFDIIGSVCGGPVTLMLPALFFARSHPNTSLSLYAIVLILIALGAFYVIGGICLIFL